MLRMWRHSAFALFFDRDGGGALAHAPTVEAECVLYCFLTGMVGGGPAWCRHGSGLAAGRVGEGVFINREQ